MITDRYQRYLRIGVKINGKTFEPLDGAKLPQLKDGCYAELVVLPSAIADEEAREALESEQRIPLLDRGEHVYLGISPAQMERIDWPEVINPETLGPRCEYLLVDVILQENLTLLVRGDQKGRLENCACTITGIKQQACSLNRAFTIVSERYETKRISHTGNVFERAFVFWKDKWQRLDDLRLAASFQSIRPKVDIEA